MTKAVYFDSPADFAAWLEQHHDSATELLVGFYKLGKGAVPMTYPQALDEALCMGWIDGLRKSVDERRYTIRFTPRKQQSYWSAVNLRHLTRLLKAKRIKPPGLAAWKRRDQSAAPAYSFEKKPLELDAAAKKAIAANQRAKAFLAAQAPSYRRLAAYWVMSAKKEQTRASRLKQLIEASEAGRFAAPFRFSSMKPKLP